MGVNIVKLSVVLEAIERIFDGCDIWVNIKTNEIVEIFRDDGENHEEEYAAIEENGGDYLTIPSQYELNGYRRMVNFINGLDNPIHQDKLYKAISSKGAFRRFKDQIFHLGIRNSWFDFERNENIKLAKEVLERNGVEYINDVE